MKDMRKKRYINIKHGCKTRVDSNGNPIEFRLTFNEWWDIWQASGKYHLYGCRVGQYCMSRYNDIGHYEVGNVFIQLTTENTSQANKGRPRSAEWSQKQSAAHKGRPLSEEHKQKMSEARKGRKQTPEHAAKRAAALKGRTRPPEVVAKMKATWAAKRERKLAELENKQPE